MHENLPRKQGLGKGLEQRVKGYEQAQGPRAKGQSQTKTGDRGEFSCIIN